MARKDTKRGMSGMGRGKIPVLPIGIGVVVLVVALVVFQTRGAANMATAPVELEGADDPATLVELASYIEVGSADASVTIVEFADFQCPACASFAIQVKPLVEAAYIEQGTAKFRFYDFPLMGAHAHAFLAARAARCAHDQDAFWSFHDRLFAEQPRWAASGNPASMFSDFAEELGLDGDTFDGCLRSDQHAETVTANMLLGTQLGVQGTPTIMVSEGRGMATRLQGFDFGTIQTAVENLTGPES